MMELKYKTAEEFLWDQRLSVHQMVDVLKDAIPSPQYYHLALVVLCLTPTEIDNVLGDVPYVMYEDKCRFILQKLDEKPYRKCTDLESFSARLVKDYPDIKRPAEDLRERDLSRVSVAKFALHTYIPDYLLRTEVSKRPSLEDAAKAFFECWRAKMGDQATSRKLDDLLRENSSVIDAKETCRALRESIESVVKKKLTRTQAAKLHDVLPSDPPFWKTLAVFCYKYLPDKLETIMYGKPLKEVVAERLDEACKRDNVEMWRVCERLEDAKRKRLIPDDAHSYFQQKNEQEMNEMPSASDVQFIAEKLLLGNWEDFITGKFYSQGGYIKLADPDAKECLIELLTEEHHEITIESLYTDLQTLMNNVDTKLPEACIIPALAALTEDFRSDEHTEKHIAFRDRMHESLQDHYKETLQAFKPFSWQQTEEYQLSDMYTPLKAVSLRDSKDSINRDTIHMNSLLQRHSLSQQYVIIGEAGSGKTAFCRKVAYEWSRNRTSSSEALGTYKFIYLIFARRLGKQDMYSYIAKEYKSVWDCAEVPAIYVEEILQCTICRKETILLIDGYDEESSDNFKESLIYKLLSGQYFPETTKIATTRPNCSSNIQNLFTKAYKIAEFEEHQITHFINQYELQHKSTFKRPDIANHPQQKFLGTPLFLWMFCIYHNRGNENQEALSSWSSFFERVILHMIKKTKEMTMSYCDPLPESILELIDAISKCVKEDVTSNTTVAELLQSVQLSDGTRFDLLLDLESFKKGNYVYWSTSKILREISEFAFQCSINNQLQFQSNDLSSIVEKLGLINKLGPTHDGIMTYEFVYKSILEYLSAHYIVENLNSFSSNLQKIPELEQIEPSDSLILWFVCGMLADKTKNSIEMASNCLTEVYKIYILKHMQLIDHKHHFIYRAAYETGGNIGNNTIEELPYFHVDLDFCTQYCFLGYVALAETQKMDICLHIENLDELQKLLGPKSWCNSAIQVTELTANSCKSQSRQTQVELRDFMIKEELCITDSDNFATCAILSKAEATLKRLILTGLQTTAGFVSKLNKFKCIDTFVYTHNTEQIDEGFLDLPMVQSLQDLTVSVANVDCSRIVPALIGLPNLRRLSLEVDESESELYESVLEQVMNVDDSLIRRAVLPDSAHIAWYDVAMKLYKNIKFEVKFSDFADMITVVTEKLKQY